MAANNAASRLLNLLLAAKQIKADSPTIAAWRSLLDASKDGARFLDRMGKVMAMPREIEQAFETHLLDHTPTRYISNQMYAAFVSQRMDGNSMWNSFMQNVDEHLINYLRMASALLESTQRTESISSDRLVELRNSFDEIRKQVWESDLPPRLKASILGHLSAIIAALEDYFLTGAEPVLERIEAMCGKAAVDEEYKGFLRDHELGQRLRDCLSAAADVVTVAVGIPMLSQSYNLLQQF